VVVCVMPVCDECRAARVHVVVCKACVG